jgi:hypothetical protein
MPGSTSPLGGRDETRRHKSCLRKGAGGSRRAPPCQEGSWAERVIRYRAKGAASCTTVDPAISPGRSIRPTCRIPSRSMTARARVVDLGKGDLAVVLVVAGLKLIFN